MTDLAPPVVDDAVRLAAELGDTVGLAVRGKPEAVRLALVALLAGSHLLLEDLPGTGKTLLAKSLAAALGGRFGRVQCTPDLLPSDITGTSVYSPADGSWTFRPGPLFANVVLIDEIHRAGPPPSSPAASGSRRPPGPRRPPGRGCGSRWRSTRSPWMPGPTGCRTRS